MAKEVNFSPEGAFQSLTTEIRRVGVLVEVVDGKPEPISKIAFGGRIRAHFRPFWLQGAIFSGKD